MTCPHCGLPIDGEVALDDSARFPLLTECYHCDGPIVISRIAIDEYSAEAGGE